jgi:hypothetical protein
MNGFFVYICNLQGWDNQLILVIPILIYNLWKYLMLLFGVLMLKFFVH